MVVDGRGDRDGSGLLGETAGLASSGASRGGDGSLLAAIAGACVDAAAASVGGRARGSGRIEPDRDDRDASLENLSHVRRSSCNLSTVTGQRARTTSIGTPSDTAGGACGPDPAAAAAREKKKRKRHDIPHQLLFQLLYPTEVGHVSRVRLLLSRSRRGSRLLLWRCDERRLVSFVASSGCLRRQQQE